MEYSVEQTHLVEQESLEPVLEAINSRIILEGDKPDITVQQQLDLIKQLAAFDLGRYLLYHRKLNGYWNHYVLTHPGQGRKTGKNNAGKNFTALENYILNSMPIILAAQERYTNFLRENQKKVYENAYLASIPAGMMAELLYLKIHKHVNHINLVGIDYDKQAILESQQLAERRGLTSHVKFYEKNAWDLDIQNQFDLISSQGLTIYEEDERQIEHLYALFYQALRYGGKLVTGFLTPPPERTTQCEWNLALLNPKDLLLQKILFIDILDMKWQSFRSTEQVRKQLVYTGFNSIQFIYDKARLWPTVIAFK